MGRGLGTVLAGVVAWLAAGCSVDGDSVLGGEVPPCKSDADCSDPMPTDAICVDLDQSGHPTCVVGMCASSEGCPESGVCAVDHRGTLYCPSAKFACETDSDCGAASCVTGTAGDRYCRTPEGPCDSDSDCSSGWVCISDPRDVSGGIAYCAERCDVDGDCRRGCCAALPSGQRTCAAPSVCRG